MVLRILLLFFISLPALRVDAQEKGVEVLTLPGGQILVGVGERSAMEQPPFSEWFDRGYASYMPEDSLVQLLRHQSFDDVTVTVVLGTWCPDSRREVPRFFRVADAVGIPDDQIRVIYVDRKKEAPGMDLASLGIERVPTFIFTRQGREIGRIVEVPRGSFEEELMEIFRAATKEKNNNKS